jgi:uncharacterized protein YkwD
MEQVYESFRASILAENNRLRADPQSYIPFLQENMKYISEDKILRKPGKVAVQLREGVEAYKNAIKFLQRQKPLDTLTYDERLSNAALDFANYLGSTGIVTNLDKAGNNAGDRIENYCEWDKVCGESIDYGSQTAQEVFISLLIDDGIEEKSNRLNLFQDDFKYIGIGIAKHRDYGTVIVIDYVGGIRDKGQPFFDYSNFKYEYPKEINQGLTFKKKEERKIKTQMQLQDEDAPDSATSVRIIKKTADRLYNGKLRRVTKKIYDLDNGNQHIVEIEDI